MEYRLIRSKRKTVSIEITREGVLLVRAPRQFPQAQIDALLEQKRHWIETHMAQQKSRMAAHPEPDELRWKELRRFAEDYIPSRLAYYSQKMGVTPTALHYSKAKTRFGSCSSKDSITFSLRLMEYPLPAIDYVVVHELAHIRHKDHSRAFYQFVASVLPDYKQREQLLKR